MLPTGVNFATYAGESRLLKTVRSRILLALLLAALLAAPLASGPYVLGVAAQAFIALIAVLWLACHGRHGRTDQYRAVGLCRSRRLCHRKTQRLRAAVLGSHPAGRR